MQCCFALGLTLKTMVSGKKIPGFLNWPNRTMRLFRSFHSVGGCTNTNRFNIEIEGAKIKGRFCPFFGRDLFRLK